MSKSEELRYGAPGENALHICVDMQRCSRKAPNGKCLGCPACSPMSLPSRPLIPRGPFSRASASHSMNVKIISPPLDTTQLLEKCSRDHGKQLRQSFWSRSVFQKKNPTPEMRSD